MKKGTIWILTVVMALMFTGLLYMQFVYIEEMVKMREQHFSEGVKRSLYSLSTALEKNETKQYLYEELLMIDPGMSDAGSLLDTGDILEYGTGELVGNEIASSVNLREQDKFREFQESLKKQYLYQKGLLNEVILSILNQSSNLPIMERADTAQVNTYLKAELGHNGINLDWEYAITDHNGKIVYKTPRYDENVDKSTLFTQTLFPNDTESRRHYLNVYFPDKDKYIFSSIRFMLPTFAFTFIFLSRKARNNGLNNFFKLRLFVGRINRLHNIPGGNQTFAHFGINIIY